MDRMVKTIAVLGAGTMGHGIAHAALAAGYSTRLYDVSQTQLNMAVGQVMSLLAPSPGCSVLSHWYNGAAPSPFTSILWNIGNVTSYFELTNSRISASVPGSCPANWLHGKPRTVTSSLSS